MLLMNKKKQNKKTMANLKIVTLVSVKDFAHIEKNVLTYQVNNQRKEPL